MEGYICHVCKNKHLEGDSFHSVLCFNGRYVATCSVECFNVEKEKQIEIIKEKLKEIENQSPHIEFW